MYLASSREDHNSKSFLLLGDFNIEPVRYRRRVIPRPTEVREGSFGEGSHAPAGSRRRQAIFNSLVEITNGSPPPFYPPSSFLNQIDRLFSSVPTGASALFSQKFGVLRDPVVFSQTSYLIILSHNALPPSGLANQNMKCLLGPTPVVSETFDELVSFAPKFGLRAIGLLIQSVAREAATNGRDQLFEYEAHPK